MLPRHDDFTLLRRAFEVACIAGAVLLLVANLLRLAFTPAVWHWWTPLIALAGAILADFVSGLVHWLADTWGSETMPVLGRRLLRPFRVHHVNPDDFLRRQFADTNGDVALIVIPGLLVAWFLPLDQTWGQILAVLIVSFCAVGLPTNQVHQWAHMPHPPRPVRWLQDCGIILSREEHRRHHQAPYLENYCIATGWCNAVLCRINFFRRLERLVTTVTGLKPRDDDQAFQAQIASLLNPLQAPEGRT